MRRRFVAPVVMSSLLFAVAPARAQGGFVEVGLSSDVAGEATRTNAQLVNPWGLVATPNGNFWVANNGTATSQALGPDGSVLLTITVPTAAGLGPTGIVFNPDPNAFMIEKDGRSGPATFILCALDGSISGWNATVDAASAVQASLDAGEVYTGMALARVGTTPYLYLANFAGREVEVYDTDFEDVELDGDFEDPDLPDNYSPFNVQKVGDHLFVAFAVPGPGGEEEAGPGLGIVSEFDTEGHFVRRVVSNGALNAPWAIVAAPQGFGRFGGALLVGNFGDGVINAFDRRTGALLGALSDLEGDPIVVEGLWGLAFASRKGGFAREDDGEDDDDERDLRSGDAGLYKNDGSRGGSDEREDPQADRSDRLTGNARSRLYFAAGIDDEEHGLFGYLSPAHGRKPDLASGFTAPGPISKLAAPDRSPVRLSQGAVSFRIAGPAAESVDLRIYDSAGRLVTTLASGAAGSEIRWDGTSARGERAQAGVYFYRARAGSQAAQGRFVLLP